MDNLFEKLGQQRTKFIRMNRGRRPSAVVVNVKDLVIMNQANPVSYGHEIPISRLLDFNTPLDLTLFGIPVIRTTDIEQNKFLLI